MKYLAALALLFSPMAWADHCINSGGDPFECFGNGTVSKPSLSVGNEGTGLFSGSNGDLRFSVLGVEVARFDQKGHFILANPVIPELLEAAELSITGAGKIVGGLNDTPIGQSAPAAGGFTELKAASLDVASVNTGTLKIGSMMLISPEAPTIVSGFGESPTLGTHNGTASFSLHVGSAGGSSRGVIGMPKARSGWACWAADVSTPDQSMTQQTGSSPNSVTLTNYARTTGIPANWSQNDLIELTCFPN